MFQPSIPVPSSYLSSDTVINAIISEVKKECIKKFGKQNDNSENYVKYILEFVKKHNDNDEFLIKLMSTVFCIKINKKNPSNKKRFSKIEKENIKNILNKLLQKHYPIYQQDLIDEFFKNNTQYDKQECKSTLSQMRNDPKYGIKIHADHGKRLGIEITVEHNNSNNKIVSISS